MSLEPPAASVIDPIVVVVIAVTGCCKFLVRSAGMQDVLFKEQPKRWLNLVNKGLISVHTNDNHTSKCPHYKVTVVHFTD